MDDRFPVLDVSRLKVPKIPWQTVAAVLVGLVVLVTAFGPVYQIQP